MNPFAVASLAFVCVFGGALVGLFLRSVLPDHHLSSESRDVMRLGAGLIGTMAALVLGLLVASAKSTFDTQESEVKQTAASLIQLDRALAHYGPEAQDLRTVLKRSIQHRLQLTWPEQGTGIGTAEGDTSGTADALLEGIRGLSPKSDGQRADQAHALEIANTILATRWLLFEQSGSSIRGPLLAILIFWLSTIFLSFGLTSAPNGTVITVLLLSAASVAISIYLIFELDQPFTGVLQISPEPLRLALAKMGG